jgi:hypothetical protein
MKPTMNYVSVEDVRRHVLEHPEYPDHVMVSADFSGFRSRNTGNVTVEKKMSTMNHLARLVYANTKGYVNNAPEIVRHLPVPDVELAPIREHDIENNTFTDVEVRFDTTSATDSTFLIIVKKAELEKLLNMYADTHKPYAGLRKFFTNNQICMESEVDELLKRFAKEGIVDMDSLVLVVDVYGADAIQALKETFCMTMVATAKLIKGLQQYKSVNTK